MYTFLSTLAVHPAIFLNHLLYQCCVANRFVTPPTRAHAQALQPAGLGRERPPKPLCQEARSAAAGHEH